MDQSKVYRFSEKAIREIKQRYLTVQIILPIILFVFLLFSPITGSVFTKQPISTSLKVGLIATVILEVEFLIISRIMLKKMKDSSLNVSDERIVRTWGKSSETIPIEKIVKLVITEKPSGDTYLLDLKFGSKSIFLYGFDDLEEIAILLQNKISESIVKRKRQKIDWNSPITLTRIMVATFLTIVVIQAFGPTYYFVFNFGLFFAMSIVLILFKPMSRSFGKRFVIFEIGVAILMMTGSLCMILGALLPSILWKLR
jgi:hypothetical protein